MSLLPAVHGLRPERATVLPYVPERRSDELLSSWLERTALWYGSSLEAFLGRAAQATGYDVSYAQVDVDLPTATCAYLSVQLGVSPWQLDAILLKHERDILTDGRITFCVSCWDEDVREDDEPYLRRAWRSAWVLHCPVHSHWLSDRPEPCEAGAEQLWKEDFEWARLSKTTFEDGVLHLLRERLKNPDQIANYLSVLVEEVNHWRIGAQRRDAHGVLHPFGVFRDMVRLVTAPIDGRMSLVSRTLGRLTSREAKSLRDAVPVDHPVGSIEERAVTFFVAHSLWMGLRGRVEWRRPLGSRWRRYLRDYCADHRDYAETLVQGWTVPCQKMWQAFLADLG